MKIFSKTGTVFFSTVLYANLCASQNPVTDKSNILSSKTLDTVIINAWLKPASASYMADVEGTNVYAGKKTNTLVLSNKTNGLPFSLGRTALAKIPGLTIWEMDGAGTQLNVGSRGTDAHRSIEMNMRQNGYNTNSDMFGYPENHYSLPMQAIEEIQLVRGAASLQFGPQFGGMMNYKLKQAGDKRFSIESEQTVGGNNFFNSYNAIGGTKGKFNYYAFYDSRHGDGWRDNARFNYQAFHVNFGYRLNEKSTVWLQFSRMYYEQQIAGGLTDAQFNENPRQSARMRNFFQPVINIPALVFKSDLSATTRMEVTASSVLGQRNSVQFINTPDIPDTFNTALDSYNPRQVDRDYYSGFTTEARVMHVYRAGRINNVLSGGVRYFTEVTRRRQKGTGTTGSDFDLSLVKPYGIDLRLTTHNYAVFAENIFQLTSKLSLTPGIRYEVIDTRLSGVISNATAAVGYTSNRSFPLFGTGVEYKLSSATQLYGNISQAYRPYLYASITPADRVDKIDPSLKDSKGYDIDLGYRGHYKNILQFDINGFYLFYGDKIGLVARTDPGGAAYLLTTNIGNSVASGVEAFAELSLLKLINPASENYDVRIFNSVAYDHARYTGGSINKSSVNTSIKDNYVENAPQWIYKTGVEFNYKGFSSGLQYSYNSKSYNDAFNTVASANGVTGLIPAWHVWDWNCNVEFAKYYHLSAGVNNATDEKYFNRRITMYPGPGILPADGRTFYISFGVKI